MAKQEEGHVVEDFYIEGTHIKICDDYCKDKTESDVAVILKRIANIVYPALEAASRLQPT